MFCLCFSVCFSLCRLSFCAYIVGQSINFFCVLGTVSSLISPVCLSVCLSVFLSLCLFLSVCVLFLCVIILVCCGSSRAVASCVVLCGRGVGAWCECVPEVYMLHTSESVHSDVDVGSSQQGRAPAQFIFTIRIQIVRVHGCR